MSTPLAALVSSVTPWGAVISAATGIIEKLIPDPAAQATAKLQLLQLQQSGELAELQAQTSAQLAQIQVDNTEASSTNWFASNWRPAAGWVCVVGLAYQFMIQPLMTWFSSVIHAPSPPALDLQTLITLLGGMLGFGTLRTVDKARGTAS